jgi:hypothetical protein
LQLLDQRVFAPGAHTKHPLAKYVPLDRSNEICDWFDQGYSYDQTLEMEIAVLKRNWPNPVGELNRIKAGALVVGAATFVCPEHHTKI